MEYAKLLLNKAIEDGDLSALDRYGIEVSDMPSDVDKATLRFMREYAEQNAGKAPSYATVISSVEGYDYIPEVSDSYEWLARQVKAHSAKQAVVSWFKSGEFERNLNEMEGPDFLEWLHKQTETVKIGTSVRSSIGRSLSEIKDSFKDEYSKRAAGKSNKRWDTPFKRLNSEIGGWFSGDVYGIMAESGRGKTYLLIKIVDSLLRQGARVQVKSFEVKEYVWISRLISIITAEDEMFVDDLGRKLGIPNKQILSAQLEGVVLEKFAEVLEALDSYYPGKLYFQGKSDTGLTRSLDDLNRELMTEEVDAVVLDPFYGLNDVYGRNTNKTTGGAAEQAASRFENIIGDHDVLGFYTVQATVEKKKMDDEDGVRELNLPTRDQVKTSKRLLDIATNLISFDSVEREGRAGIGIEKGRNGGEDFFLELLALFDYGVLKEMETGESVVSDFDF